MSIDPARINIAATEALSAFESRVAGIPYERKGILYSEMFFLYSCAQAAKPSAIFPVLFVVSSDPDAQPPDPPLPPAHLPGPGAPAGPLAGVAPPLPSPPT